MRVPGTGLNIPWKPAAGTQEASNTGPLKLFQTDEIVRQRESLVRAHAELVQQTPEKRFRVHQPLRVGVVGLGGMGGSGKVAREVAEALAKAGHKASFISTEEGFFQSAANDNLKLLGLSSMPATPREPDRSWTEPLAQELADTVRREGLDILNVHYVAGLLDAALLAKELLAKDGIQLKVVATLHGSDVSIWGRNPKHMASIKEQLEQADEVTAVSFWLAGQATEVFDLKKPVRVIENSIDSLAFHPGQWTDIRSRVAPRGEVVFCHVSNMRNVKRPVDAVDVFAKVVKAGVPAKLLLVGDGPMLEQMYDRAKQHGVADDILCAGPQPADKVPRYVAASDLVLVTSESESFCLAALEAMACGVPVIGTHCGGLDEIMATVDPGPDRVSRLLANVGDTDGLAVRALGLLRDPDRYQRVQKQCARVPLERYPPDRTSQGYLTLLDDLRPTSLECSEVPRPQPARSGPVELQIQSFAAYNKKKG